MADQNEMIQNLSDKIDTLPREQANTLVNLRQ
jgi:hypothetical protein